MAHKHGRQRVSAKITHLVIFMRSGWKDQPPEPLHPPYFPPRAQFKQPLPPPPPSNIQANGRFSAEREPIARGLKSLLRRERYMGGHKRRNAHNFWFPQGRGGHDARYKDVRRGRGRPA